MCGFVGMIALNGCQANAKVIERMSAAIQHRGPDQDGHYLSGAVALGFRRLAILDLTPTGHQPMLSPDGDVVLVFNGEIYNYLELRRELEARGHRFASSGDSEVLLHAYLEWGNGCLERFNGMWAFLVYDIRHNKVFGSRDRFGKKPLYRYRHADFVFFGSEIKAILASGVHPGTVNWRIASRFLLQGKLDGANNQTFYSDIEEIPAGSAFVMDLKGNTTAWRFWSIEDSTTENVANPASSFYDIFHDAMKLRMRSDVPVGVFLSGGLDSTSIICDLAKMWNGNLERPPYSLRAFTYHSPEFDESAYICDTIRQTGAQLDQFEPDTSLLWHNLEKMLWHQDEPVHSVVPLITFDLFRMAARSGYKVILNGQGADEVLAGYWNFFTNYWYSLLKDFRFVEAWREIAAFSLAHQRDQLPLLGKTVRHSLGCHLSRFSNYRKLAERRRLQAIKNHPWFTSELSRYFDGECTKADNNVYDEPSLNGALKRAVEQEPLPLYLRIEDRNSMAHSVEVRLPFLDYRLVSLAFGLPCNWRVRGPWNKYVLRQAMEGRIPNSVRNRVDKMGFPAPWRNWFAESLHEPLQDTLNSRKMRERGIYNINAIRRDLELHRKGQHDVSGGLFDIAQFEVWSDLAANSTMQKTAFHYPPML
jgi:asparagine synthase (glutamine-hydrolysing)